MLRCCIPKALGCNPEGFWEGCWSLLPRSPMKSPGVLGWHDMEHSRGHSILFGTLLRSPEQVAKVESIGVI